MTINFQHILVNSFWSDCLYQIYSYENNEYNLVNHYIKKEFYNIIISFLL